MTILHPLLFIHLIFSFNYPSFSFSWSSCSKCCACPNCNQKSLPLNSQHTISFLTKTVCSNLPKNYHNHDRSDKKSRTCEIRKLSITKTRNSFSLALRKAKSKRCLFYSYCTFNAPHGRSDYFSYNCMPSPSFM